MNRVRSHFHKADVGHLLSELSEYITHVLKTYSVNYVKNKSALDESKHDVQ